jgi:hypothetical protein
MTKKTLLLALVAVLACCAPASANVLTLKDAKKAAKRLAAKQVQSRQIVSFHIVKAKRVSPRAIKFAYDDRSAVNVFCTSVIVVKLPRSTSRTATASFDPRTSVCRHVPDAALAFEAATRNAVRQVSGQAAFVKGSLNALKRSSLACRRLRVPASRAKQVALFTESANTSALYGPVDTQLQAFVNALGAVQNADATLVAAAAGWADLLEVYRSLPSFQPSLCGAVKRWAAANWAASAAPADYTALKALDVRATGDQLAIARGAKHLAAVGVFPRTAASFTAIGLVAVATGDFR